MNFWDYHISDHKNYIRSYGEGEGSPNRNTLFKYIHEGESVLDVGCGPSCNAGHARDILGWKNFTYKGVDISEKFIEASKELFPEYVFEIGDANKLNEDDKSFDVVILQDVLEHINGYKHAISEAVRVARKRVVICMWVEPGDNDDIITDKGDNGYHSHYNREKLIAYLERFGSIVFDEQHANRSHWYFVVEL